jgi:hypothetical protein
VKIQINNARKTETRYDFLMLFFLNLFGLKVVIKSSTEAAVNSGAPILDSRFSRKMKTLPGIIMHTLVH